MQQLFTCGMCGQQVYIDPSLHSAQACPTCKTVLTIPKADQSPSHSIAEGSPNPSTQYSQTTNQQSPAPNSPVPHRPTPASPKPNMAASGGPANQNPKTLLYVAFGIGSGITVLLLVYGLYLTFAFNPHEQPQTNEATNPQAQVTLPTEHSERKPIPPKSPHNAPRRKGVGVDSRIIAEIPNKDGVKPVLAFSPDSKLLFTGSFKLRTFDLKTKKLVAEKEEGHSLIRAIAVMNKSRAIVAGGINGKIIIHTYDENGEFGNPIELFENTGEVTSISVSKDDQIAMTGSRKNTVCIWDLNAKRLLHRVTDFSRGIQATYISDDKSFGYAVDENSVKRIDLKTGEITSSTKVIDYFTQNVRFTGDGQYVLATERNNITVFNLITMKKESSIDSSELRKSLEIGIGSNYVYSGARETITKYEISTKKPIDEFQLRNAKFVSSIGLSPDGKLLATYGIGHFNIRILNVSK